jgi:hypothetical protein
MRTHAGIKTWHERGSTLTGATKHWHHVFVVHAKAGHAHVELRHAAAVRGVRDGIPRVRAARRKVVPEHARAVIARVAAVHVPAAARACFQAG